MVNKKLLKYLQQCKNLELSLYTQEKEVAKLNQYIATLGRAKNIEPPAKRNSYGKFDDEGLACGAVVVDGILSFLVAAFFMPSSSTKSIFALFGEYVRNYIISFIILAILLEVIDKCIFKVRDENCAQQEYLNEMNKYKKEQNEDIVRVKNELKQASMLKARVSTIQKQIADTQSALNKLYSLDIIKLKYQALIPVVMFCDYIENERCYQLEGHEGAYNLYEDEKYKKFIIVELKQVLNKLDEIKQNQESLYNAIQRGNRISSTLCNVAIDNSKRLKNIEDNSAISAENSRISAQNSEALKNIEIYKLLKK